MGVEDRSVAKYPVIIQETADPTFLNVHTTADSVVGFLEEFADILAEFRGWDSLGRRLDLPRGPRAIVIQTLGTPLLVTGEPDPEGLRRAIDDFMHYHAESSGHQAIHESLHSILRSLDG